MINISDSSIYSECKKDIFRAKKRAEEGMPEYQYALGIMYLNGDEVFKDYKKARHWILESANNGYEPAIEKACNLDLLIAELEQKDESRKDKCQVIDGCYIDENGIRWNENSPKELSLKSYRDLSYIYSGILLINCLYVIVFLLQCYISFCEEEYSMILLNLIWGSLLVSIGFMGAASLKNRKPNAIYLCNAFVWLSFYYQILDIVSVLAMGKFPTYWNFFITASCLVMLCELYSSYDIKKVFPKEYRFASKLDKMLVWGCAAICLILLIISLIGILFLQSVK